MPDRNKLTTRGPKRYNTDKDRQGAGIRELETLKLSKSKAAVTFHLDGSGVVARVEVRYFV